MDGRLRLALAAALATGGCATLRAPVPPAPADWRAVVLRSDVARLSRWRDAIVTGRRAAIAMGHGAAVEGAGALLQPDVALGDPLPPPGAYACGVTKMGAKHPGLLDYVAYPAFRCTVTADGRFVKETGSQRHVGRLYPHLADRGVMLGALSLGDEGAALPYGTDPNRDIAGVVQRIGPQRWRIVFPEPAFESRVDILSLDPV